MRLIEELNLPYGIRTACRSLAVPRGWYYRQQRVNSSFQKGPRPTPKLALSEDEKAEVRSTLNSERFMDQSPREVYASLLDEGIYLCHWRTIYRVLAEHDEVRERRDQRRHPQIRKPQLVATRPNELWVGTLPC